MKKLIDITEAKIIDFNAASFKFFYVLLIKQVSQGQLTYSDLCKLLVCLKKNWREKQKRKLVATLTFVYSVFSGHVVCSPHEFFSLSSSTLPSRSRSKHRILPVTRRSKRLNEYFFSKIVPLWNSLPEVIVRAKNAAAFKRKVRQWLS
ncbi:hypothetical protein L596_030405 [Steinernema carpocapsae]|uniref:Uncharacterized protein n=1 Tax=Steinernema carpocapsae TaxID=34508 RepID=A0A4V5ZWY1_STECR|nr:hypothetical protein L596_030405 [Steinernema carpocapsae]